MKVTGVLVALAAAAPLASAIPFRISDLLARAPEPVPEPVHVAAPVHVRHTEHAFPQYRSLNLTTRGFNGTVVDKRAIIPEGVHPRNITKA